MDREHPLEDYVSGLRDGYPAEDLYLLNLDRYSEEELIDGYRLEKDVNEIREALNGTVKDMVRSRLEWAGYAAVGSVIARPLTEDQEREALEALREDGICVRYDDIR